MVFLERKIILICDITNVNERVLFTKIDEKRGVGVLVAMFLMASKLSHKIIINKINTVHSSIQ
jgi:hypothetical protein